MPSADLVKVDEKPIGLEQAFRQTLALQGRAERKRCHAASLALPQLNVLQPAIRDQRPIPAWVASTALAEPPMPIIFSGTGNGHRYLSPTLWSGISSGSLLSGFKLN